MTASIEVDLKEFNKKINGLSEAMDKARNQLVAAAAAAGGTITVVLGLSVAASPEVKEAFAQLKESLDLAKDNFGQALAPAILNVVNVLKVLVDIFNQLPAPIQKFGALAVTFGTIMIGLVILVANLAAAFSALAFAEWAALLPLLKGAAIIAIIVGLIVGLAYAIYQAYNRFTWFRTVVDTVWAVIKGAFQAALTFIGDIVQTVITVATDFFRGRLEQLVAVVTAVWQWIREAFDTALTFIRDVVQTVMTAVTGFFQSQLARIQAFWEENGEVIMAAVEQVWGWIEPFVTAVMQGLLWVIQTAWGLIKNVTVAIWNGIKNGISAALNWINTLISTVMSFIMGVMQRAWGVIQTITKSIWIGIKGYISTVLTAIMGIVKAVAQLITGDWRGALNTLLSTAREILKSVWNTFNDMLGGLPKKALAWGRNLIQGFIKGIQSMMSSLANAVGDVVGVVGDFLGFSSPTKRGPGRKSHQWAPNFMEMFSEGIQAGIPQVRTAALDVASTLAVSAEGPAAAAEGQSVPDYVMVQIDLDKRQFAQVLAKPMVQMQNRMVRRNTVAKGMGL